MKLKLFATKIFGVILVLLLFGLTNCEILTSAESEELSDVEIAKEIDALLGEAVDFDLENGTTKLSLQNKYIVLSSYSNDKDTAKLDFETYLDCKEKPIWSSGTYAFDNFTLNGKKLKGTLNLFFIWDSEDIQEVVYEGEITYIDDKTYTATVKTYENKNDECFGYIQHKNNYVAYKTDGSLAKTSTSKQPDYTPIAKPTTTACSATGTTTGITAGTTGTTIVSIPAAPGAATVTVKNTSQLSLSWTAVTGATAYEVWYGTSSSNSSASWFATVTTTSTLLWGLSNGTTYYIWLKVKNSRGTSEFGAVANGTPGVVAPTVTTAAIAGNLTFTVNIAGTSAKGGGHVTDDGGATVDEMGVCWNTSGNPTTAHFKETTFVFTGEYTDVTMNSLTVNTVYYVRAYAVNSRGTSYGNQITFNSGKTFGTDYAGGYVFYNDGNGGGLVSAKTDQSTGIIWAILAYQTTLVNGTLYTIGSGSTNTDKIIAQNGVGNTYAAGNARSCTDGGYSDWFLPSRDELDLMYTKLKKNGVGSFAANYYWSSSENDYRYAVNQNFSYDSGGAVSIKSLTKYVRAIRAF